MIVIVIVLNTRIVGKIRFFPPGNRNLDKIFMISQGQFSKFSEFWVPWFFFFLTLRTRYKLSITSDIVALKQDSVWEAGFVRSVWSNWSGAFSGQALLFLE